MRLVGRWGLCFQCSLVDLRHAADDEERDDGKEKDKV